MSIDSVLLIGFGGPDSFEDVRPFLANVLRGKNVPPERVETVVEQYRAIGGRSPIKEITLRQAAALERALATAGHPLRVYVGMRNWTPYIAETLRQMREDGRRRALGVILSPLRSEPSWERYIEDVAEARKCLEGDAPEVEFCEPWSNDEFVTQAIAEQMRGRLVRSGLHTTDESVAWIFTAHSIPLGLDAASGYSKQFAELAARVAKHFGKSNWHLAYQSRSGSPRDPWLEPDIAERLAEVKAQGASAALAAPIGFVADHVEVLFDLDIKARQAAEALGLPFLRAPALNDHPKFIEALTRAVLLQLSKRPAPIP